MKICFLTPIYPNSSNQRLGIFIHEQAKYISKKGHKIYIITLGDTKDKSYEIKDGVEVHRVKVKGYLPFKGFFFSLLMIKELIFADRKLDFDIINAHFTGTMTALIGIYTRLARKPFVVTAYGIGLLTNNIFKKALNRFFLVFPSKIVCISNYVAKLVRDLGGNAVKNKIVIVKCGVDPEKLNPTKSIEEFKKELGLKGTKEKILLSVANLVERKGIDIIINCLPQIIKVYPNIKYFIIGRGSEKENLLGLVNLLKLEKYVTFIDYVADEDLANFYNICDIFVLMSRTIKEKEGVEGFGIVYIEASYLGKPVIGGKSGGTADSVIDGVTGYRINPDNKKEFINKAVILLKDSSLRKQLGNNGKNIVRNELLWSHNANKMVRIYDKIR